MQALLAEWIAELIIAGWSPTAAAELAEIRFKLENK